MSQKNRGHRKARAGSKGGGARVACGKICYASRSRAKSKVKQIATSGKAREHPGVLDAYFCGPCQAWHVGHRPAGAPPRCLYNRENTPDSNP